MENKEKRVGIGVGITLVILGLLLAYGGGTLEMNLVTYVGWTMCGIGGFTIGTSLNP